MKPDETGLVMSTGNDVVEIMYDQALTGSGSIYYDILKLVQVKLI